MRGSVTEISWESAGGTKDVWIELCDADTVRVGKERRMSLRKRTRAAETEHRGVYIQQVFSPRISGSGTEGVGTIDNARNKPSSRERDRDADTLILPQVCIWFPKRTVPTRNDTFRTFGVIPVAVAIHTSRSSCVLVASWLLGTVVVAARNHCCHCGLLASAPHVVCSESCVLPCLQQPSVHRDA